MDFPQRLRKLMEHYDLNAQDLARRLNMQKSAVSHLLSGRNKPRFDVLAQFAREFPELNIRWLLTGEGPMTHSPTPSSGLDQQINSSASPQANSSERLNGISPAPIDKSRTQQPETSEQNKKSPEQEFQPVEFPDEIVRVYPDGTFDILRRRNR